MGKVHAHLKKVGTVAGYVPVVLREEQKRGLAHFPLALRVYLGPDELALRRIKFEVGVGRDGGSKVADEYVPVDDQLKVPLRADLAVPKCLVIIHMQ